MLIKRVSLHNVKSYERADIPFQPGINFVCGENGAGKTTIIEAVGYCLFGHLPYSLAEFLRNGRGKGRVEVVFTARDGCDYQVTREFDAKTSKSPRVSDGAGNNVDLHGNADYDAWFRATAGLEPDMAPKHLFEQVLGVSQGTFAAPFLQSAGVRRSVFDALFRVNSFRNAHDRALPAVNALRDRIVGLEKDEALIAQRLEPVPAMQLELAELRATSETTRAGLAGSQAALAACEREAADLKLLADEVAATEKRSVALAGEVAAVADRATRLKQEIARCEEARHKADETKAGHGQYLALAAEISACETRISELTEQERLLQAGDRQLTDVTARVEQGETAFQRRTQELAEQRLEIGARLAAAEAELTAAQTRATTLAGYRDQWRATTAVRDAFANAVRTAVAGCASVTMTTDRARDVWERLTELQARMAGRARLAALAAELPAREETLRTAQTELAKVRERHAMMSQNREHAAHGRCPFLETECATIGAGLAARFDELLADLDQRATQLAAAINTADAAVRESADAKHDLAALEPVAGECARLDTEGNTLNAKLESLVAQIVEASSTLSAIAETFEAIDNLPGTDGGTTDLRAGATACRMAVAFFAAPASSVDASGAGAWAKQAQTLLEGTEREVATAAASFDGQVTRLLGDAGGEVRSAATKRDGLKQQEKTIAAATAALAAQRSELDALVRRSAALASECDRLRRSAAAYGDPRAELQRLREQQAQVTPAYEAYIRHLPDAERLAGLLAEAEAVASSLTAAREEQTAVNARLDGLRQQFRAGRLSEVEQQLRAQHARVAGLQQQLADLSAREANLARQLADLEALRAKQTEVATDLTRHREALTLLDAARQVLNGAGEPVAEHFRRQVSADADRIQRRVAGDAAALVWDRDYEVALTDSSGGTERRRVFAQLSGGEQMTVALALRIALLRFLSPIRVGFFDEPTVNLDTGRRTNLATMLRGLAGEVGQLFLISHDDTFDSITENVTYLQKVAGVTSVREEAGR